VGSQVEEEFDLGKCSYYIGMMDREEAEKLLQDYEDGVYILRLSNNGETYVLSIVWREAPKGAVFTHVKITSLRGKFQMCELDSYPRLKHVKTEAFLVLALFWHFLLLLARSIGSLSIVLFFILYYPILLYPPFDLAFLSSSSSTRTIPHRSARDFGPTPSSLHLALFRIPSISSMPQALLC
jgi:hypothetical protein